MYSMMGQRVDYDGTKLRYLLISSNFLAIHTHVSDKVSELWQREMLYAMRLCLKSKRIIISQAGGCTWDWGP